MGIILTYNMLDERLDNEEREWHDRAAMTAFKKGQCFIVSLNIRYRESLSLILGTFSLSCLWFEEELLAEVTSLLKII